ncbi:Rhodanese-like domain protein [Bacillus thuringiensis]|uniref:Rhodanese-like domain protein n=5 Tax=Bacillus cereus group TaxID=86661 RepID=A0A1C4AGL4_BACTU|nr:Rhodanese-like domain protein [Bacillus thuringiensis]
MFYIVISLLVWMLGILVKRYIPVLNVAYISLEQVREMESVVVDVRNYTESHSDNTSRIMCIPYAYLKRYYHEIPNKPLHLIVHNKVDRNLSVRFLRKGSIFKAIVYIWTGKKHKRSLNSFMDVKTILNVILIVLVSWFIISRFLPVRGVKNISGKDLKRMMGQKNKQFIDVRTVGEYRGNHMKGFQNIPLNELASKANQLDKNKEVIVICQSGMRSKQAAKVLKKLGFQHVINVSGGMNGL